MSPFVPPTYDRLGRQKVVTDALGTREFSYRSDLQLDTEEVGTQSGDLYSLLVTRKYQTTGTNATPGRSMGFKIGPDSSDPDGHYDLTYGYDAVGRLSTLGGVGLNNPGGVGLTYAYPSGNVSDSVASIAYKSSSSDVVKTTFTYDPDRDLLTSVDNARQASPAATISNYAYVNDTVGRRTSVVTTGEAFTGNGGDHHWRWSYNDRSEVTGADRCTGTTLSGTCSAMTPDTYDYAYDPIGNRDHADKNGTSTYYCTNNLNQYETRKAGSSGCPQTTPDETFTYDADGNLIADANFYYRWDAENRLIEVEAKTLADETTPLLRFAYDYMSRRIQKRVYGWNPAFEMFELRTDRRFVYDDWNVVLVLRGTGDYDPEGFDENDVLTKYAWGLDLSGQRGNPTATGIHGAGGIGGLVAVEELVGAASYWFLYDANGNVSQVIQNTSGYPVAAHYEYDAYGNVLGTPTGYAATNPFRFSTKWFDVETRLGYWGHRYYNVNTGRWMSRDPLQEDGGVNLYRFVNNRPQDQLDPDGRGILDYIKFLDCIRCALALRDAQKTCEKNAVDCRKCSIQEAPDCFLKRKEEIRKCIKEIAKALPACISCGST